MRMTRSRANDNLPLDVGFRRIIPIASLCVGMFLLPCLGHERITDRHQFDQINQLDHPFTIYVDQLDVTRLICNHINQPRHWPIMHPFIFVYTSISITPTYMNTIILFPYLDCSAFSKRDEVYIKERADTRESVVTLE